jgi:hypothetical protein
MGGKKGLVDVAPFVVLRPTRFEHSGLEVVAFLYKFLYIFYFFLILASCCFLLAWKKIIVRALFLSI